MKKIIQNIFIYWIPLLAYLSIIFFLSHTPDPVGDYEIPVNDKLIHFIEFFPLPFLFFRAFASTRKEFLVRNYFLLGLVASVLYAASDEFHQYFISERDASFLDLLADCAGIFVGGIVTRSFVGAGFSRPNKVVKIRPEDPAPTVKERIHHLEDNK